MSVRLLAVLGAALVAVANGAAAQSPTYTRAATQACLTSLPHAVAGLPPAQPPAPPALFVYALAHDDISSLGSQTGRRPHTQLGAWYGDGTYRGITLTFFASAADARASSTSLPGVRIRNVRASWDRQAAPDRRVRDLVLDCLRSGPGFPVASSTSPRPASLATFAGRWGGHTRGLSVSSSGRGSESADDGCCTRVYELTFRIVSVSGTLTKATAVYRVTSFTPYEKGVTRRHAGDVGRLLLRNGIVTDTLTRDVFCSDPAWGATGACGA